MGIELISRKMDLSVKKILNGGGSLSIELIEDAIKCFSTAKLLSAYGMTETCSSLTFITIYDPATNNLKQYSENIRVISNSVHPLGGICVGKPAPHVEILITQEEFSHVGKIMTRGPHVMIGYWGQISSLENDGGANWFDTGDSGHIDGHGNLWLVGRRNCRIKSGGENVYPEEVEVVLSQHPGISAVVVIGLPHASLGEMVFACVQIKEYWVWIDININETQSNVEWQLSARVLKEYCRQNSITGFKIPKGFMIWRKPFPLTSTGKVKRDQVKAEAVLQLQPLLCNL
ncbi:2-succinylbenzoate--CoA ligase chloroplastic/peroxisomal [Bienertia sinuspersici]